MLRDPQINCNANRFRKGHPRKLGKKLAMLSTRHGPLTKYVQLRVAHVPGMPEMFFPPPRDSVPDTHHGTCVTHVP